jgi:hypothetical protein
MSIHPTTTNAEIAYVCECIRALAQNHKEWANDYDYNPKSNEYLHKQAKHSEKELIKNWFTL